MKTLSRHLLRIVTGFVPVVIAACYGAPYDHMTLHGKTVDSETGAGIKGLSVSCMRDGQKVTSTVSQTDGSFDLGYRGENPCDTIAAEDVDGTANGSYATATAAFDVTAATTTIALQKK